MKFYIIALLLAYFQSSVLLALFQNTLTTPNLLLVFLFLNLVHDETKSLRKAFFSGFFLDAFQDSMGLHMSAHVLFILLLHFFRQRLDFPTRLSLLILYVGLSFVEKVWILLLLRMKYFIEINLLSAMVGYTIELLFLLFVMRFYNRRSP